MTPGNYGTPDPAPTTWPPPPAGQSGVWPPPPDAATVQIPFKYIQRRAASKELRKAHLSDFREGSLQIGGGGLTIAGKAVLRAEIRYPIFVVALLIVRLLGLVAYLVMEYAFRQDAVHQVTWDAVRLVQIAPQKQQACVVYDAPNYKGVIKTFSLAFSLDPVAFPTFAQQVAQFAPGRLSEGSLRNAISVRIWIRLIVVLLVTAFAVVAAVMQHH